MLRTGYVLHQRPAAALTQFRTDIPDVFHVSHMGIMQLSTDGWQIEIGGLVERPMAISWDQFSQMPRRTVLAAHECAGSPLAPTKPVRRVANVQWEGVPLAEVLGQVGVKPAARFLWSTGADAGTFAGVEQAFYQKDLPLEKALSEEVLLATHINGEPLAAERGGPVRLVVPGFYGTNSTKWLRRLELCEARSPGYFTTTLYNDTVEQDGKQFRRPVWSIAPHSLIVSHSTEAMVQSGLQEVRGWAWAASGIASVEVSVDGGTSWQQANLGPRVDFSWQKFSLAWAPDTGSHHLICRAIGNDGSRQPETGARNEWFSLHVRVQQS